MSTRNVGMSSLEHVLLTMESNASILNMAENYSTNSSEFIKSMDNNNNSSREIIIVLCFVFFTIGVIGIGGNLLVILSVMFNRKMRSSMTNLLITNLALADLVIMLFGIPEIVLFIRDDGWTLNMVTCKVNRYILVVSLYGSILTLLALSVERYIAIIHPIKAHILCNKRRLVVVLGCIWPFSWAAGLPTLLYNTLRNGQPGVKRQYCMVEFPGDHESLYMTFKYTESALFYVIPLAVQCALYYIIAKNLFRGTDRLYRRVHVRDVNGIAVDRISDTLQARRGVVKMLILSVMVYFASYSPHQVLLVWNTISPKTFQENWSYLVTTMVIAYINSAANPIMYNIFSQNFRKCYKQFIFGSCEAVQTERKPVTYTCASTNANTSPKLWRHVSMATASSNV